MNEENKEVKFKATFDEEGNVVLKSKSKIKKGRLSRAQGIRFENKVREYWESQGWVLDKWTNNVDLSLKKIIPAKRKFNPFMKILSIGTGFPDFIGIKNYNGKYEVIGIEVKMKGILSKVEKDKCKFYLDNGIFNRILVAKKGEQRGKIEYINFKEKWMK